MFRAHRRLSAFKYLREVSQSSFREKFPFVQISTPAGEKQPRYLSAEEAVAIVQSGELLPMRYFLCLLIAQGWNVFSAGTAASPTPLLNALNEHVESEQLERRVMMTRR